ncbi:hypothetical protein SRABI106_03821 [Rahnella aquatilis]|nr:hypothetical protein SRABI106_03821 [Rahnella aquatilis]
MLRIDDDLKFRAAVNMINFHQLDQADRSAFVFNNKAAFALVVNMLVIQVGQFDESLVRFFKPVTHDAGVIIKTMNKRQVVLFQWT